MTSSITEQNYSKIYKKCCRTSIWGIIRCRINIRMIDQGFSEMNILVGTENDDFEKAIKSIYKAFN